MTQVARTTNDIIDAAYRFLGEVGEVEPVTGTMLAHGLYILNELVDQFSAAQVYIPYTQGVTFTFTPQKGTYSFSDVVSSDVTVSRIVGINYANYTVQNVPYPIYIINKSQYFNIVRLNNLYARPSYVYLDRQITQSFLTFYAIPDQAYTCSMGLKLMIAQFMANTVITNVPPYYHRFLRYALTRELKGWYPSGKWSAQDEQEYMRMFNDLQASNELDLTITPTQIMMSPYRNQFNWQNIFAI